jgi:hypothetical protein
MAGQLQRDVGAGLLAVPVLFAWVYDQDGDVWGAKKPASPLGLTDRGRIAPASRRSAGGAGVSTSAMGHSGDIQAKDPIDCGEPLFAAAIAGAAAPISAAAA